MTTKTTTKTARNSAAKQPVAAATNVFSSLAKSGSKTLEGIVEIDKALLGYARNTVVSYVDHGKASLSAKDVNTLIDLQASFLHTMIETGAANTREVVDLTKTMVDEAYAPVKEAIASLRDNKAA